MPKMLVQGPCGPPRHYFLPFLTPKSDSPGRKTGHMFLVTPISKVKVKKTEVNGAIQAVGSEMGSSSALRRCFAALRLWDGVI